MNETPGQLFGLTSLAQHTSNQLAQLKMQTELIATYAQSMVNLAAEKGGMDSIAEHCASIFSSASDLSVLIGMCQIKSDELNGKMRAFGGS
jgi:hypothetical protein